MEASENEPILRERLLSRYRFFGRETAQFRWVSPTLYRTDIILGSIPRTRLLGDRGSGSRVLASRTMRAACAFFRHLAARARKLAGSARRARQFPFHDGGGTRNQAGVDLDASEDSLPIMTGRLTPTLGFVLGSVVLLTTTVLGDSSTDSLGVTPATSGARSSEIGRDTVGAIELRTSSGRGIPCQRRLRRLQ